MEQTTWKGTVVKPLSEQLSELAARVKTAEDILAAARQKTERRWKANESSLSPRSTRPKIKSKQPTTRRIRGNPGGTRRELTSINDSMRYAPKGKSTEQNAM
jgi:hypothetical protein